MGPLRPASSPHQPSGLTCVKRLALACLLLVAVKPAWAVEEDVAEKDNEGFFGLGWLDATQSFSSTRADALAAQLDRFFGVERSDLEAAYSSLRFIPELRFHENDGVDPRVRLRGRLYLPRISERLSLIFSEDQGEGTSYYQQDRVFNEPQSTRVNVELKLNDNTKHRFDFRVGLRSSMKLRTSVRYRYESPISEKLSNRLSETVYFIDGRGFGSFTQYQLDRGLSDTSLLRWSSEYRHEEKLDGDEWSTSLSYLRRQRDSTGVSYFARMAGNVEHSYVELYQIGVRWRGNVARPWLFWEFAPGYQWEKTSAIAPRDGSLYATISLEMAIGRQ